MDNWIILSFPNRTIPVNTAHISGVNFYLKDGEPRACIYLVGDTKIELKRDCAEQFRMQFLTYLNNQQNINLDVMNLPE